MLQDLKQTLTKLLQHRILWICVKKIRVQEFKQCFNGQKNHLATIVRTGVVAICVCCDVIRRLAGPPPPPSPTRRRRDPKFALAPPTVVVGIGCAPSLIGASEPSFVSAANKVGLNEFCRIFNQISSFDLRS